MKFSVKNNRVVEISLYKCNLKRLPDSISNLKELQILNLKNNILTSLSESIIELTSLRILYLNDNYILNIPESIGELNFLESLMLDNNRLITLPDSIGNLSSLKNLYLNNNLLIKLPESIIKLTSLQFLNLWRNPLAVNPYPKIESILKRLELNGVEIYFGSFKYEFNELLPWYYKGCMYFDKKEYDVAIEYYKTVIQSCPDYLSAWYYMGNSFFKKGKYDTTLKCYYEVVSLDPSDEESWFNIGNVYLKKENFESAIKNLRGALEINNQNFKACYLIGITYELLKNYKKAIKYYERALEIEPENKKASNKLIKANHILIEIDHKRESEKVNVFLSYSTLDSDSFQIGQIAEKLENYPIINKVFIWEKDSGINIVNYMETALNKTDIFILFCSENSLKSKSVEGEWQAAYQMSRNRSLKIIPVYKNEEYVPNLLRPMLRVKYFEKNFESFIKNLYNEILRKIE